MHPPALSIAIIKRARKLLRAGKLTHRDFAVADALLWCCRSPTSGRITVSMAALARLCHCARSTIAAAITRLEGLRILSRIRRYGFFAWACGGLQARRLCNCYVLSHTSDAAPANYSERVQIATPAVTSYAINAAMAALAARRRVIEARMLMNK